MFWAGLKRSDKGANHKFSSKHLKSYVEEHVISRHNQRAQNSEKQMGDVVAGMAGKRLR